MGDLERSSCPRENLRCASSDYGCASGYGCDSDCDSDYDCRFAFHRNAQVSEMGNEWSNDRGVELVSANWTENQSDNLDGRPARETESASKTRRYASTRLTAYLTRLGAEEPHLCLVKLDLLAGRAAAADLKEAVDDGVEIDTLTLEEERFDLGLAKCRT